MVSSLTYNPVSNALTLPKSVALFATKVAQLAWWPLLSPDEVERRYLNDKEVEGDWDKLGITPEELENVAITYVRRYRNALVLIFLPFNPISEFVTNSVYDRTNFARPVKLPTRGSGSSSVCLFLGDLSEPELIRTKCHRFRSTTLLIRYVCHV